MPSGELPTQDEVRHLRHALYRGHMFRTQRGTVVINPNPRAPINVRHNAKASVVELLLHRGWLHEDRHSQFWVTDAGRDAIDAWDGAH